MGRDHIKLSLQKIMTETAFPKTLVIIPALNEQESIAGVIDLVRQQTPWADIVVINDGSSDDTGQIAEQTGAIVLHLPYNVGIGAGVQTGFMFADLQGYDIVIRNDGDGQHTPTDIPEMLRLLRETDTDIVIGSRYLQDRGYLGTPMRRLGSMILARLISAIIRQRVTDPTSGFTACNRRAIKLCAQIYPHDYPEPESIVLLHRAGLKLREIPVEMKERTGGQSSITPVRSAYYMAKVTLAILVGLLRPAPIIDLS
jgi:glycosyltransferase involved in cell wall biosynthesis